MKKYLSAVLILVLMLVSTGCYLDDFSSGFGGDEVKPDSTDGLNYRISEDKQSYYITEPCSFTGSTLVIPDTYNGLPVTEIKSFAFYKCSDLSSVTIGKNIKNIEESAFYECGNIKEIVFNAVSCNDFVSSPFDGLGVNIPGGASVVIGKDVERIPNLLFGASEFDLTQLDIGLLSFEEGSKCKEIGNYAFCRSLGCDSIVFPESLEVIGENAFASSNNLLQVTLPQSLKTIGYDAFLNCFKLVEIYNLSSINIQIGNMENGRVGYDALAIHYDVSEASVMTEADGFVFVTREGENLLLAYVGDEINITLPAYYQNAFYALDDYAFYYSNIESIVIPQGVTGIGFCAFRGCFDLKYATFEDPYGWRYGSAYTVRDLDSESLKDSVKAAQMLGGGSSINIYSLDTERWYK